MSDKILEAFGLFIVMLEGDEGTPFKTVELAEAALAEFENGAEQREVAANYCAHMASVATEAGAKSFQGKAAVGKANVIISLLGWLEAGSPGPVEKEVEVADEEVAAETETNAADTGEF